MGTGKRLPSAMDEKFNATPGVQRFFGSGALARARGIRSLVFP
jgi:hypothetical protein